jgi:hypothetical protein
MSDDRVPLLSTEGIHTIFTIDCYDKEENIPSRQVLKKKSKILAGAIDKPVCRGGFGVMNVYR